MPDFKARDQQVEMSRFIHDRLQQPTQRMAVVEAPTGVGKTLGYLSGAIETALNTKKLLVISTATVNLQQQLIQKDLPQFSAALPQPIRFMQIKGRRRYVCPSKLAQLASTPEQQDLSLDIDEKYQQVLRQTQAKNLFQDWDELRWDGDRDNRKDALDPGLWHEISTDSEGCAGKSCRYFLSCPYYLLRKEMQQAQVVVVNHDLLLSDADLGGGLVLPNPEELILIFDEAHNLPQKALDHAAKALNFAQLYQTVETAASLVKKLPSALAFRQHDFGYMFKEIRQDLPATISLLPQMHEILSSDDPVNANFS